jgi:excisionase family DNA binding protein
MTVAQVAEHLNVCRTTVYNAIDDGKLRVMKFGPKTTRIRPEDLDAYKQSCLVETTASSNPSSTDEKAKSGMPSGERTGEVVGLRLASQIGG